MLGSEYHSTRNRWEGIEAALTSPASWLTVGLFAFLAGGTFVTTLNAFLNRSSQALSVPPPQPIDVNQLLIRPFPPRRISVLHS